VNTTPSSTPPSVPRSRPPESAFVRPDLLNASKDLLTPLERAQLAFVRRSFQPGAFASSVRWCQRTLGSRWLRFVLGNLFQTHHRERLPDFSTGESYIMVCNHRSFFDLYAVVSDLVHTGLRQRIVFPVRSNFFYDNPLGLLVNGSMSFFAMYPPVFREAKKAQLNMLTLDELAWLLRQGGHFVGFHPEGTRNMGDPYTLLPARTGIGRLVHKARVKVVPVFINGLDPSDMWGQIRGNFSKTGAPIHTVFGHPIDFEGLLDEPASQSTFKKIANKTRDAIVELAEEERRIRFR
jgi:1-acyl-sn-glycerol-3-phosphate acyltransferase